MQVKQLISIPEYRNLLQRITKVQIAFVLAAGICIVPGIVACSKNNPDAELLKPIRSVAARKTLKDRFDNFRYAIPPIEVKMINSGLVDIHTIDSSIVVKLMYSTEDNFLGENVYGGMQKAYLQPDVAKMLVVSQKYLKSLYPDLSLIVYDAARPRHIQQKMWDAVDAPFEEKVRFLANPRNGSIHNFGAAVDVSIVDQSGMALDMGTEFDHMGELAYPRLEKEMLEAGRLQRYQLENRLLLRRVMRKGGFWGIQTEWWHFNACTRQEARERYEIIE